MRCSDDLAGDAHKCICGQGFGPDPTRGTYSTPSDLRAGLTESQQAAQAGRVVKPTLCKSMPTLICLSNIAANIFSKDRPSSTEIM